MVSYKGASRKVTVKLDARIVQDLARRKKVGESYSQVLRRSGYG